MGGIGSGKFGKVQPLDDYWSFSLTSLVKAGYMVEGKRPVTEVCYQNSNSRQTFFVKPDLRQADDPLLFIQFEGESYLHEITLEKTSQPFGGHRWWMRCPRSGVRCHRIFFVDGYFMAGCTIVSPYLTQQVSTHRRRKIRANDILQRHGIDRQTYKKPKGMHWLTYHQVMAQVSGYEE